MGHHTNTPNYCRTGAKVWSAGGDFLPGFIAWCARLANKINDPSPVFTNSGIDNLPLPKRVESFPEYIIAADWNDDWYRGTEWLISMPDADGVWRDLSVFELELSLVSQLTNEVRLRIAGTGTLLTIVCKLDAAGAKFVLDPPTASADLIQPGGERVALATAFETWPPALFTASLARIDGDLMSGAAPVSEFDKARLETVDWASARTNPHQEKPNGKDRSIFEWLVDRLQTARDSIVIFADDDSGEAADFLTLAMPSKTRSVVTFYHCKAAGEGPVPGRRIDDLYEVIGQAIKSPRLFDPASLLGHIERRSQNATKQRFIRGKLSDVQAALARSVAVQYRVTIVQPGVGTDMSPAQDALLAAASTYLIGSNVVSFDVIGGPIARRGRPRARPPRTVSYRHPITIASSNGTHTTVTP